MVIAVRALALTLGYEDSGSLLSRVKKMPGITTLQKRKLAGEYGNQAVWTISPEDANTVRTLLLTPVGGAPTDRGVFYLIQLLPTEVPNRVKVGFTSNISKRLAAHKTTCPDAIVVNSWECNRNWEAAALVAFKNHCKCSPVGVEVFDCEDLSYSEDTLTLFFSWLTYSGEVRCPE